MMNPFTKIKDLETRIKFLEADRDHTARWELTERVEALTKIISNASHVIDPKVRVAAEVKLLELIAKI